MIDLEWKMEKDTLTIYPQGDLDLIKKKKDETVPTSGNEHAAFQQINEVLYEQVHQPE